MIVCRLSLARHAVPHLVVLALCVMACRYANGSTSADVAIYNGAVSMVALRYPQVYTQLLVGDGAHLDLLSSGVAAEAASVNGAPWAAALVWVGPYSIIHND